MFLEITTSLWLLNCDGWEVYKSGFFFFIIFRDGKPYCEKDYQAEFGVTCAGCGGYIIGKVLQVK